MFIGYRIVENDFVNRLVGITGRHIFRYAKNIPVGRRLEISKASFRYSLGSYHV